jgi:hypothetical protein
MSEFFMGMKFREGNMSRKTPPTPSPSASFVLVHWGKDDPDSSSFMDCHRLLKYEVVRHVR